MDRVIEIDQSPIGVRPLHAGHLYRIVAPIREIFARFQVAGARHEAAVQLSTSKGGRCEACQATRHQGGNALSGDVYVPCDV